MGASYSRLVENFSNLDRDDVIFEVCNLFADVVYSNAVTIAEQRHAWYSLNKKIGPIPDAPKILRPVVPPALPPSHFYQLYNTLWLGIGVVGMLGAWWLLRQSKLTTTLLERRQMQKKWRKLQLDAYQTQFKVAFIGDAESGKSQCVAILAQVEPTAERTDEGINKITIYKGVGFDATTTFFDILVSDTLYSNTKTYYIETMLQQYDYLFLFITGNLLSGSDAALIKRLFADDKPFLVVRADCSVDLQSVYDAERKRNAVFNDFDWNLVKQRLHLSWCKKLRAQLVAVNRRLGRSVPMFFISVNLLHAALNHHQRANEDEQTFQRFELDERALVRHLRQEMSSYDGADYSQ